MKDVRSWRNAVGIKDMRILTKDVVLEEFYMTVDQNLSTEHGRELKKQRRIQVEGDLEEEGYRTPK